MLLSSSGASIFLCIFQHAMAIWVWYLETGQARFSLAKHMTNIRSRKCQFTIPFWEKHSTLWQPSVICPLCGSSPKLPNMSLHDQKTLTKQSKLSARFIAAYRMDPKRTHTKQHQTKSATSLLFGVAWNPPRVDAKSRLALASFYEKFRSTHKKLWQTGREQKSRGPKPKRIQPRST